MSDLLDLQEQRAIYDEKIKLGEALQRLRKNKDFKLIIETMYLHDEALRLVNVSGAMNLTEASRESVFRDMHGISSLTRFLDSILRDEHLAREHYEALLNAIDEEETGLQEINMVAGV